MFHSNPYYYWSLMSVVMYVGIVCSVLVLMIMFTDTVCRFTVFLLVELLCPLLSLLCIGTTTCSHNGKDDVENILAGRVCDNFFH